MQASGQPIDGGVVIVFEGIDGSGKTTQVHLAHEALQKLHWPVYATRNLGGTPIGEALRQVILSKLERPSLTNLYISVAIQEALIGAIQSERDKGRIILMDRGPLSLAAYEVYGAGLNETLGWQHVDDGMNKIKPDLTIIYRTDIELALEHASQKSKQADYFESKSSDFFEKVSEGYEATARRYPEQTVIIDGNQSIEAIHEQTMDKIQELLDKKQARPA